MSGDRWEYKRLNRGYDFDDIAELDKLGAEGWELVSVTFLGTGTPVYYYLKRRKLS